MSALTPIESRLLSLILQGKSNEQIATELNRENNQGLRNAIAVMYKKLSIDNPREIIPRAEELRQLVANPHKENSTL